MELFLEQDLSDLDFSQFHPMQFEVVKKDAAQNVRLPIVLPVALLEAVKARAKEKGIPYARYVRMVLESDLQAAESQNATKKATV